MKAILLCAGLGTRLRPLTQQMPKCLLPLAGRPLIDYWLVQLLEDGAVQEVLVNVHHLSEQVVAHLDRSSYRDRITIVHEGEILGTAGTLLQNFDFYESDPDVLLIHGDNFYTGNIRELIDAHHNRPRECQLTMLLFEAPKPEHCGVVTLDDRNVVVEFVEKVENPPGNLANAAIYAVCTDLVRGLLGREVMDFSLDVIPNLVQHIFGVMTDGDVIDIGTPETYQAAQEKAESQDLALR